MIHNFKYAFKTLLRNKMLIFWTFAFPIILGTFFNMAFSDIENNEKLDIIDIAIVNNDDFNNDQILKETFSSLSNPDNENQLFNIKYKSLEEAKYLLNDNKITGYVIAFNDKLEVVVNTSGINETVLKYVVDEILETKELFNNIEYNELLYNDILEILSKEDFNIKDISSNNLSYTMIEFYTLIAMTCLYGGILGTVAINQTLANMSSKGLRVSVSPISKGKLIISSVLSSYLVEIIGLFLLFIYTIFILKIDYGNNLPLIILLSLTGGLAGLTLGICISSIFKTNDNVKTGIVISITMLGCFLSGMMGITMKYIVDKNIPLLNKINPANMITDGFYSLYYYDTLDRYYFNILSLLIFTFLMISISYISLRRQKYDSI